VDDIWPHPTLTGELVELRPMAGDDADAMWEMVHDPEGNDLTATVASFTRAQIDAWCSSRGSVPGRLDLTIVERSTGQVAGEVVLNEHDPSASSANFRIALRGPAWYGRGLGGEATRLIVDHGLEVLGLHEVRLEVLARNVRARRAYESAGFREVGNFDDDDEAWIAMAIRASGGRTGSR
jgi:RimJ/RimL family protein N-acetyltransferase